MVEEPVTTSGFGGVYRFEHLPLRAYQITAVDIDGRLRAKASGVQITSDGEEVTRDLLMEAVGNVILRLLEETGRFFIMLGRILFWAPRPPYDVRELFKQMQRVGVNSVPVVFLTMSCVDFSSCATWAGVSSARAACDQVWLAIWWPSRMIRLAICGYC